MKFIHNDPLFKQRRRSLRKNSTRQEVLLWNHLKSSRLGKPFRRQFSIGPYIADFYCHELRLVIELDGEYHQSQLEYDAERDRFMTGNGHIVLRFSNSDINTNLEDVLSKIRDTVRRLS